jgi:hypothetical protein
MRPSNILTSVRASCSVPQNPFFANVTILVEYRATEISIRSGTVASRVTRPINSREPQTISTTPTNSAMTCGQGMPIFTKRPIPRESGNKNFCIPSERNTQPTRIRISKTVFDVRTPKLRHYSATLNSSPSGCHVQHQFNRPTPFSFRYSMQVAPRNARICESQPSSQAPLEARAT